MTSYFRLLSSDLKRQQQEFVAQLGWTPGQGMPRLNGKPRKPNDGYERGVGSEERFFRICCEAQRAKKFPQWLSRITWGTNEDDQNGIDFVAWTHGAPIPIQVKSSPMGKRYFYEKPWRRHIICIVVSPALTDEEIFKTATQEISFVWDMRCKAMAAL